MRVHALISGDEGSKAGGTLVDYSEMITQERKSNEHLRKLIEDPESWPRPSRLQTMLLLALLCAPALIVSAAAEDLASYAKKCNQKTLVEVKGFNCLNGAKIPMEGVEGGNCKKPPYLDYATCRSGSRFGVQQADADVAVVWLCRKKKAIDPSNNIFDDIAIIQTNFKNGATCFYQRLGDVDGSNVPAPLDDYGNFWMSPTEAASQECASCHDSGLLRTPYLTQLNVQPNVLPKTRHKENYWFPGADFAGWNGKVYKLEGSATTTCSKSGCHIMGANTIDPEVGTSSSLGPQATGAVKTENLEGQFAFWMKPNLQAPDPTSKSASELISKCAHGQKIANCNLVLWGGEVQAIIDAQRGRTLPMRRQPLNKQKNPHDKQ
jgi:hypothetical protein